MMFTHKLARRLALMRNFLLLAAATTALACEFQRTLAGPDDEVSQLVISPRSTQTHPNQTIDFTAVALAEGGDTVDVAVTWSVTAGAIVDTGTTGRRHYGHFRAGQETGGARVVVRTAQKADTASVMVLPVPVRSVDVTPAAVTLLAGEAISLVATPRDSAGGALTDRVVTWSSSAPGVGSVSATGVVAAVGVGTATISATSEGLSGTATVTVSLIPVATVTVAPASASVEQGKKVQLTATMRDADGNTLTGRPVAWTTGNAAVATVSTSGLVTGVKPGSATITATSEGKMGSATVGVTLVPVATVTVTPASASIEQGKTLQLTATLKDASGNTLTGRTVAWSTGNAAVATVSPSGVVTGVTPGSAAIAATSEGKSGNAAVTVTVPPPPPPPGTRAGYYVTPGGSSAGDGSASDPWDLRTALGGAGGRIDPGDTVWVRGGTYAGSFTSSLTGTATAPIIVRAYPGERAIIDGNGSGNSTFVVDGAWAVYWGLEIMNSMTARYGEGLGLRPTGVYVRNADNVKLVNLIVHDTGHGTYTEYTAQNIEIYGWVIFNGGHQNSSRSDGHGIYIKHDGSGNKVVRDNVIFNQFGFGIHGYTESSGALRNMVFEGNVLFNNGELSDDDNPNLQIGGNRIADNNVVADNMTYFSPGRGWWNFRIGYSSLVNGTTVVRNNYVVGGGEVVEVGYWQNLDWLGNTFVGSGNMVRANDPSAAGQEWSANVHYRDPGASAWRFGGAWRDFGAWRQASGWAATDQAVSGTPTATRVFVRPNLYESGRATVVVYNWAGQASVGVNLAGIVPLGHTYEIRNVQRIFDPPLSSGTYGGGTVTLPMDGVTAHAPIGGSPSAPVVTGPAFDVFVVTSRAP